MSAAREEILARIRRGLADVPAVERPDDVPVARDYRRRDDRPQGALIERLAERLRDYHAEVRRVRGDQVTEALDAVCAERRLRSVVVPAALPAAWRPTRVDVVVDDGLPAAELDRIDGAVTGCAVAIADTGTIVLDGQGTCGRRAITLVPDHHLCVVRAEQVVALVPEAVEAVAPAVIDARSPITLISGPSASSDIELSRVEGVHGPRNLIVLLAV